jgi:hypothetical protein
MTTIKATRALPTSFIPTANEAQAALDAFADSPYYEDRFAAWSLVSPNAMKRRWAKDVEKLRLEHEATLKKTP